MGKKVLLADDSATIQKLVEMALSDSKYELLAVSDGRQAIDALANFQPDIILADAIMPDMDGYEVCQYVKNSSRFHDIPVILLTGRFQPFDSDKADEVAIDERIVKPFSQEQLLDAIDGLVPEGGSEEEESPESQAEALGIDLEESAETMETGPHVVRPGIQFEEDEPGSMEAPSADDRETIEQADFDPAQTLLVDREVVPEEKDTSEMELSFDERDPEDITMELTNDDLAEVEPLPESEFGAPELDVAGLDDEAQEVELDVLDEAALLDEESADEEDQDVIELELEELDETDEVESEPEPVGSEWDQPTASLEPEEDEPEPVSETARDTQPIKLDVEDLAELSNEPQADPETMVLSEEDIKTELEGKDELELEVVDEDREDSLDLDEMEEMLEDENLDEDDDGAFALDEADLEPVESADQAAVVLSAEEPELEEEDELLAEAPTFSEPDEENISEHDTAPVPEPELDEGFGGDDDQVAEADTEPVEKMVYDDEPETTEAIEEIDELAVEEEPVALEEPEVATFTDSEESGDEDVNELSSSGMLAGVAVSSMAEDRHPEETAVETSEPEPEQEAQPVFEEGEDVELQNLVLSESQMDQLADMVANRILKKLGDDSIKDVVWNVVPELAEAMIKKKIYQLEQTAEAE